MDLGNDIKEWHIHNGDWMLEWEQNENNGQQIRQWTSLTQVRRSLKVVAASPMLWGTLCTVVFYKLVPYVPAHHGLRTLVSRYFCSHPLEYATTGLFFVGIAILVLKAVWLLSERTALNNHLLSNLRTTKDSDPVEKCTQIAENLQTIPKWLRRTQLARRLYDVCSYVFGRRSTQGLEDHLKYLAELASERLHGSYALIRTITWAVPILGFLGTVIGITIAIANVTPGQLDTSLEDVTSGLAVAFDTTALALALSMVLVFSSFVVEQSEQHILSGVEEYGIKRIGPLFPTTSDEHDALVAAEVKASEQLLAKTEVLITWQTDLWQKGMDSLRQRWMDTLEQQQLDLQQALQQGMSNTLNNHSGQLAEVRIEFLKGLDNVTDRIGTSLSLWHEQTEQTVHAFSDKLVDWQNDLTVSTDRTTELVEQMRSQSEILLRIVHQEEQLTRLQDQLTKNLQAIQTAETFEQTLHSLIAAVHLLTARTKPKAA